MKKFSYIILLALALLFAYEDYTDTEDWRMRQPQRELNDAK